MHEGHVVSGGMAALRNALTHAGMSTRHATTRAGIMWSSDLFITWLQVISDFDELL